MTDESLYFVPGYQEIMAEFPRLLHLDYQLKTAGFRARQAILPDHLRPKDCDPNGVSTIMGLPVLWGDRVALVVDA